MDVQVLIHTDTLNESGFVDNTIAAIKGRTIHSFHTEGAGLRELPALRLYSGHRCFQYVVLVSNSSKLSGLAFASNHFLRASPSIMLWDVNSRAVG